MDHVTRTRCGALRGFVTGAVAEFKGIPYAAPPFGVNRFRPPQPVETWSGVRDALAFGPKPPQLPYPAPWDALVGEHPLIGEDCLNLNLWCPEPNSGGHPVMVWIPGGAFEHGTAAVDAYEGSRFARDGVVCVTVNYRVGIDGFLYLGDGDANPGLLDQIAALRWVQDNIGAFGGDRDNVTVFGESAGAMSIAMLLAMPQAKGLFRRAVLQSGGANMVVSAETARRVGRRLAGQLGVAATRDAIAAVPLDRLFKAQTALTADLIAHPDPERWGPEMALSLMPWQPVVDGDAIPARPLDLIKAGAGMDIELMAGSNAEEWNFFSIPIGDSARMMEEPVAKIAAAYGLPLDATLAAYRAADPGADAGKLLAAIKGDWYFRIPALQVAESHAQKTSATYMYEFAWRSPQFDGRLGACHGLEIAFVFDTLGKGTEPMSGKNPPQLLANAMHAAWTAFASSGDPGWPKYALDRRATMRFDDAPHVVEDPRSSIRTLWSGTNKPGSAVSEA